MLPPLDREVLSELVNLLLEKLFFVVGQFKVKLDVFGVVQLEDGLVQLVLQFKLLGLEGAEDLEELGNNLVHHLLPVLAHLLRTPVVRLVHARLALQS